jgi:hypothetical protein
MCLPFHNHCERFLLSAFNLKTRPLHFWKLWAVNIESRKTNFAKERNSLNYQEFSFNTVCWRPFKGQATRDTCNWITAGLKMLFSYIVVSWVKIHVIRKVVPNFQEEHNPPEQSMQPERRKFLWSWTTKINMGCYFTTFSDRNPTALLNAIVKWLRI